MPVTKDLAEILTARDPVKYREIVERAANEGYNDFKFDCIPEHPEYADCFCPKMQLVEDLTEFPELNDIRRRVIDGDFDEPVDPDDRFRMRVEMMNDCVPDAIFTALGFDPPTEEEREAMRKSAQQ